jgi:hypothetical protein
MVGFSRKSDPIANFAVAYYRAGAAADSTRFDNRTVDSGAAPEVDPKRIG